MAHSHIQVRTTDTSLWNNRRCLAACIIIAIANLQYGYDTSAIGALQAMPGFLKVFGYPDKTSRNGYEIDVSLQTSKAGLVSVE
jgi:hypothetical protein